MTFCMPLLLTLGLAFGVGQLGMVPGTVREVQYPGALHMRDRDLNDLTGVRPGTVMNPELNERGRTAILAKYRDDGRFFACVELEQGGRLTDTRVVYQVVEGPVVKVTEVQFRGNTAADTDALLAAKRGCGLTVGEKIRPTKVKEDVAAVVQFYREIGFADAIVMAEVVRSDDMTRVTVVYHIVEGKQAKP